MKVVYKIFTIVLLLFITISSIGISFYLHQCGCRQTTLFSFEAGYSESDEFCCCSAELQQAGDTSCNSDINDEKCCKEQYYFILLPLGPEKAAQKIQPFDGKLFKISVSSLATMIDMPNLDEPAPPAPLPPLLSGGKSFVLFSHQIKIPFPIA